MIEKPVALCGGCPLYEAPFGKKVGFSHPDGDGLSGVLMIAEALGEAEEKAGIPLVGKAGHYLFSQLNRVGIEREQFMLYNVVGCRPPDNKLVGAPYEQAAISHCTPNLDAVIEQAREHANNIGKTFVIMTLGRTAFKRVMHLTDKHPTMHYDYIGYPFWNEKYKAWVLAADHPSFLMRGQHHLVPILHFVAQRAIEIGENGFKYADPMIIKDPPAAIFSQWVDEYIKAWHNDPTIPLVFDIETPFKKKKGNEEDVTKEFDSDYTILRCSFAYRGGEAISVPWEATYFAALGHLFASPGDKIAHNAAYDVPRVSAQLPINGRVLDSMIAWHVLNSAMPKGLGFIAPFFCPDIPVWKHLGGDDGNAAHYNAFDSYVTYRCFEGIRQNLKDTELWDVFEKHVVRLDQVLGYMSRQGVALDLTLRKEAEVKVSTILADLDEQIQAAVPPEAVKKKVFKKAPKSVEGLEQVPGERTVKQCSKCGELDVKATHFKSVGKKRLNTCVKCQGPRKKHCELDEPGVDHELSCDLYHHEFRGEAENPCLDGESVKVTIAAALWAKPLPFKLSKNSLTAYQKVRKHNPVMHKKKITYDEKAVIKLRQRYPTDPLYPLIIDYRGKQKLLGTYIGVEGKKGFIKGGLPVGKDARVHTLFTHNPSTLRSASQNPNLQNIPRPGGPDDLASLIRNLFYAQEGSILHARDYSGIEAKLVGYFARMPDYIRLCNLDVHSFYTAYGIYELDKRIPANDLPLLSWDDDKLKTRLGEIKKEFGKDRNSLYKHLVHGANFMQSPAGAREKILLETGTYYDFALVQKVMEVYFSLFPGIRKWHGEALAQADRDGYLRNPFGYVHRFYKVFDWEKIGGVWQKKQGPDANKVIAFGPQSTAAGIIKEAMIRLYEDRFEEAGQYLRLLIHDELFFEVPLDKQWKVDAVVKEEMERPIREMPLPPSYKMGEFFMVSTEEKYGPRWGMMKG